MKYEPIKIRLEETRLFEGKELTHLTMRQPTANDVILSQHVVSSITNSSSQDAEQEAHLFANLTNTTREFIGSLSVYDYTNLAKAYECFFLPMPKFVAACALHFPSSPEEPHSETSA
ncbi:TPA: phage tail assembly protein [Vibrio cholerae]|nr:phage tail assembly protein [Vibrio cholerae]